MKNTKSRIPTFLLIASSALFAACGGGGAGGGGSAASTVPTIAQTSVPTSSPNGGPVTIDGITLSTGSLSFTSQTPQTFDASDKNYSGQFTVSGCAGIVKVTSANYSGPQATFTVTPVAGGTCSLVVGEKNSNSAALSITATITQGTIQ